MIPALEPGRIEVQGHSQQYGELEASLVMRLQQGQGEIDQGLTQYLPPSPRTSA